MGQCHHHRDKERRRSACIVCILIIILLIILLLILYFSLFKPKDPKVLVPVMQMASYNLAGTPSSMSSLSFALNLQVYISNPNRGDFYMEEGSTGSIYYGGAQMGVAFLPNNTLIPSQSFTTIVVSVGMHRPITFNMTTISTDDVISVPISTVVTVVGHVTTAGAFSHHSDVVSVCNVSIVLGSPRGYIRSYNCLRSYSLNDE